MRLLASLTSVRDPLLGDVPTAREQGLEVVPLCPFMAAFIDRHGEYEDLVAPGYRDRHPKGG